MCSKAFRCRQWRFYVPWLVGVVATLAQAQPFEITGIVRDNLGVGIPGVTVTVNRGISIAKVMPGGFAVETDAGGRFRASISDDGSVSVVVSKAGYARESSGTLSWSDRASVTLSKDTPSMDLSLTLVPAAGVRGRIVDFESNEPIPNFEIAVRRYTSEDGQVILEGHQIIKTSADGDFDAELAAGNYVIETGTNAVGMLESQSPVTEDLEAVDRGYRRMYFPGGVSDPSFALPVRLTAGNIADVGTLALKKEDLYRVLIDIAPQSCPHSTAAESPTLLGGSESNMNLDGRLIRPFVSGIPCGPFLLPHRDPGSYELVIYGKDGGGLLGTVVRYTLAEQNLRVPVTLTRGSTLEGRIVASREAGELPVDEFKVSLYPVGNSVDGAHRALSVGEDGEFSVPGIYPGPRRVQVDGLGQGYYVREIRYGQLPGDGNVFDYIQGGGLLEVEIDREPATLSGRVTKDDQRVAGADVALVADSRIFPSDRGTVKHVQTDDRGEFSFSGLPPGEYHVFMIPAEQGQTPANWQQLVQSGHRLVLKRGDASSVSIEDRSPAR